MSHPVARLTEDRVEARTQGRFGIFDRSEVDYIDVAAEQIFSMATGLIPFLAHDDANRALMGSNMQRQAVPCVKADPPLVGTGMETRAALDSGQVIVAEDEGKVVEIDAAKIVVQSGSKKRAYPLITFMRSNTSSTFHHTPRVTKGERVEKGQLLADNSSTRDGGFSSPRSSRVSKSLSASLAEEEVSTVGSLSAVTASKSFC